jgi:hypothetical protein
VIELTDTYATALNSDGYTDSEKVLLLKWLLDRSVSLPEHLRDVAEIMGAAQDKITQKREDRKRKNREAVRRFRAKQSNECNDCNDYGDYNHYPPSPSSPPKPPLLAHTPVHALSPGAGAGAYARGDIPALPTVASVAESAMGVPRWYAEWWYGEMSARDWRNTNGSLIGNQNWRPTLKAWYNRAKPEELEKIRDEHERRTRELQPPADMGKPEFWLLCAERCANCTGAGCRRGVKTPPDRMDPARPPEECPRFQPLPEESPQEPPRSPQEPPQGSEGTRTGGSPKTPPEAPREPNPTGSSYQHTPKLST